MNAFAIVWLLLALLFGRFALLAWAPPRAPAWVALHGFVAFVLATFAFAALAAPARAAEVPAAAHAWQRTLVREAQAVIGPAAPIAVLAAQLEQESAWNPAATSRVGAQGLAQFMPATAAWIPDLDATLAPADPMDPRWAIRAQVVYMAHLTRRNAGATACDTWAFGLSSYNGGERWLRRDQAEARRLGLDAARWFGQVELAPDPRRAAWAVRENRGYPRRILRTLTPRYARAGWGPDVGCSA
jgi:soluble lytic murein transglycosylase-like protein